MIHEKTQILFTKLVDELFIQSISNTGFAEIFIQDNIETGFKCIAFYELNKDAIYTFLWLETEMMITKDMEYLNKSAELVSAIITASLEIEFLNLKNYENGIIK